VDDIPCDEDVVVGSQPVTVTEPSRIWIHGHGSLRDNGSNATTFGLWLRLRNASDTATLAVSTRVWDANVTGTDTVFPLTSGHVSPTRSGRSSVTDRTDTSSTYARVDIRVYIAALRLARRTQSNESPALAGLSLQQ
jgi:hypothetical protein